MQQSPSNGLALKSNGETWATTSRPMNGVVGRNMGSTAQRPGNETVPQRIPIGDPQHLQNLQAKLNSSQPQIIKKGIT